MSVARSVLSSGRLAARRSPVVRLSTRQLHRSTPSFASEIPRDPLADPKLRALQDKLGQNPAALEAIKDLGQLMISKGVDISKGSPSKMQIASLMLDKEVRDAVTSMMQECQKAGVELDKDTIQALAAQVPKE